MVKTMLELLRFRHEASDCNLETYKVLTHKKFKGYPKNQVLIVSKTWRSSLFTLLSILILTINITSARPYNTTLSSSVESLKPSGSSQERTRILSFPRRPTPTRNTHDDEEEYQPDIVFPDSLESFGGGTSGRVSFDVARIETTPDCASNGGTFCEDIPAYPFKLLRDVLSRSKSAAADSALFGADETPDEIAQRIGEPEENYICGAVDKTVFPKAGKNKSNKWKYIINQGSKDGYVQGVRVELCISMGKPCDLFGSQPDGYVTSCKQKYIYRKMMSLSEGGQPIPDTFLMPSACCCSYKRDNRFLARFGEAPVTPAVKHA